jgi:S1-C subfamily serine protease
MMHRRTFGLLGIVFFLLAGFAHAADDVSWLGVQLARGNDRSLEGVSVFRVIEGSPADKGGLRARDRITAVGGQAVLDTAELIGRIQSHETGSWIALTIQRDGDERDLRVRLASKPETRSMKARTGWIGVKALALPPALREHFGAPADAGVMISGIEEGSPAESAGFELGDVVFELDGEPVKMPTELYRKLAGAGVGNEVEFLLTRWGVEMELEATIERAPEREDRP